MTSSQSRPDSPEGAGALQHWRDRILNAVLWTLVIAGFFAWLPSTVLGLQQRLWWVVLVNNLGYALLLSIRFARRLQLHLFLLSAREFILHRGGYGLLWRRNQRVL